MMLCRLDKFVGFSSMNYAMVQDFEEPFFSQIHCDRMERGRGGQVKLSFLLSFLLSIKIKTKSFLKGKNI